MSYRISSLFSQFYFSLLKKKKERPAMDKTEEFLRKDDIV